MCRNILLAGDDFLLRFLVQFTQFLLVKHFVTLLYPVKHDVDDIRLRYLVQELLRQCKLDVVGKQLVCRRRQILFRL